MSTHNRCHDLVCNASRERSRGESGSGCSCETRAAREADLLKKALVLLDKAQTYVRSACKNAAYEACDLDIEILEFLLVNGGVMRTDLNGDGMKVVRLPPQEWRCPYCGRATDEPVKPDCTFCCNISTRVSAKDIAAELRLIAAWIRTPGNIWREDVIDECARVLENRAAALIASNV